MILDIFLEYHYMSRIIGRIYKIVSSKCDGCYIGSTTHQLNTRLSDHKSKYKLYITGKFHYLTSFEVLKFVDAKIELVHKGVFDSKADMEHLEGEFIRTTPNAVNKHVAGWTGTKQEYQQQYKQDNREIIRAYNNTKHNCSICGGKYNNASKVRHVKSRKHQTAISSASSVMDTSEEEQ